MGSSGFSPGTPEHGQSMRRKARRYLLERGGRLSLSFQCRPDGTSGAGEAQMALGCLEVRVRYVAPKCANALRSPECPDGLLPPAN